MHSDFSSQAFLFPWLFLKNQEMETLNLTLKAEWFKMIEAGKKKEEYRSVTKYWIPRLTRMDQKTGKIHQRNFEKIVFHFGYTAKTITFKCNGIKIGFGKPEWGAPRDRKVFIIKLGERIQ